MQKPFFRIFKPRSFVSEPHDQVLFRQGLMHEEHRHDYILCQMRQHSPQHCQNGGRLLVQFSKRDASLQLEVILELDRHVVVEM
jgi:hypothetical protein